MICDYVTTLSVSRLHPPRGGIPRLPQEDFDRDHLACPAASAFRPHLTSLDSFVGTIILGVDTALATVSRCPKGKQKRRSVRTLLSPF